MREVWQLEVVPEGVGMFLVSPLSAVKATFTITVHSSKPENSRSCSHTHTFATPNSGSGWSVFLPRAAVMDPSNKYLNNDALKVSVKICLGAAD